MFMKFKKKKFRTKVNCVIIAGCVVVSLCCCVIVLYCSVGPSLCCCVVLLCRIVLLYHFVVSFCRCVQSFALLCCDGVVSLQLLLLLCHCVVVSLCRCVVV